MSRLHFGNNKEKAQAPISIYHGDENGKAKKVNKIYCGDENGKAKLVYTIDNHLGSFHLDNGGILV